MSDVPEVRVSAPSIIGLNPLASSFDPLETADEPALASEMASERVKVP